MMRLFLFERLVCCIQNNMHNINFTNKLFVYKNALYECESDV